MPQVVDHLAELTAFRDRDLLDASLAGALRDMLRPTSVCIQRCVGQGDQRRWLMRARLGLHDLVPSADPLGSELEGLPLLEALPGHHDCLKRQQVLVLHPAGGPAQTLFPLTADMDVVGVLEVCSKVPLAEEQRRLVSSVLRVFSNFQGLLDYSERDTLTGLLNRKTFDENFSRVVAQLPTTPATPVVSKATATDDAPQPATRRGAPDAGAWLGMIDIDHFKRVNDLHGHLMGDEVLLLLSRLMRNSFRFHDHLYRFGGEEFVVLMRCGQTADAVAAFERLRRNIEHHAFPRVGTITVSIGFTRVRPVDTPTSAYERADKAVYFSKQQGRNQVADHSALVAAGRLADSARASDVELF